MLRKLFIVLFLIVLAQLSAMDKYNSAMGIHIGASTGNGYSFRKWGETSAYQLTFSAYATGEKDPNYTSSDFTDHDYRNARKMNITFGGNYLWGLLTADHYNFYLMTGMSYTFRKVKRYYSVVDSKFVRDDRWAIGVGPGFEVEFSDRFHLSIELPITYKQNDDITMYIPCAGFYYYFK